VGLPERTGRKRGRKKVTTGKKRGRERSPRPRQVLALLTPTSPPAPATKKKKGGEETISRGKGEGDQDLN